jgi:hypothetical protein
MLNLNLEFECPRTRKPVVFEIKRDPVQIKQRWPTVLRRICPHCGERHRFSFKDGIMQGALYVAE